MPNTAAAKKALRVSARRRVQNTRWQTRIDVLRRKFKKAVAGNRPADAQTLFRDLQKALDAAAQRHVIHKNTAARTKSRLASTLQRAASSQPDSAISRRQGYGRQEATPDRQPETNSQ